MEKKLLNDSNSSNSKNDDHQTSTSSSYLKPKSKVQMIEDLNHLRKTLGLHKTDGNMSVTHEVVKTKGSLLDVWYEMKQKERQ